MKNKNLGKSKGSQDKYYNAITGAGIGAIGSMLLNPSPTLVVGIVLVTLAFVLFCDNKAKK